ncbi:MAG: formylglycine-generating enzyme family protein, partial [bacterium]
MPVGGAREVREAIVAWKEFLGRLVEEHPGNRVVFACRSLDYSAPLSTPNLRVPQIVIEPMSDEQVEQYLAKHVPGRAQELWANLRGTDQLEVMRSPYFLSLLVEQVETGQVPTGRAGLFTGFVRQALRRELERDNPLFSPNGLLDERDVRRVTQWRWKTPWELPERGLLVPKLTALAFSMQDRDAGGGASQVRIGFDDALRLLDDDRDEDIVRAGVALAVLDEDAANDEILFFHQLVQEYFAARQLGAAPDPARVAAPWKAVDVTPRLEEMIATLPAGEALPALPTTGWEETALLATAMTADPDMFLTGLQQTNLALAGRCASQSEVRERVSHRLRDEIRAGLVTRCRAPDADLRARIDAGLALGELGDPRFERGTGPYGEFLLPPLVEVPGGRYPIGEDAPLEYLGLTIRSHVPRHEVVVAPFRIGQFPVTNAEWACFEKGGGYDDERWWDTAESRRWRSGEGTADGARMVHRYWRERFRADPALLESAWRGGQLSAEGYEQWRGRMEMGEEQFAEHLRETFPGGRLREPKCWRDARFNNPAQPVVGVCWFEARAYCSWLAAQSGIAFRLPTEVEWEAAARGREGRDFASGDDFDALRGNTAQTLLKRTSPIGVFPSGDTPEGVSDLAGNVEEWTSSLFGPGVESERAPFRYPYAADDGREDPQAPADVRRVLRGGAWHVDRALARAAARLSSHPAVRENECGFRTVSSTGPV